MKNKLLALLALFSMIGYQEAQSKTWLIKIINNSEKGFQIWIPGTGNVTYSGSEVKPQDGILIPNLKDLGGYSEDRPIQILPDSGIYQTKEQKENGESASQHRVYKIWDTGSDKIICNWDNDPGWNKTTNPSRVKLGDEYGTTKEMSGVGDRFITITISVNGIVTITDWRTAGGA